MNNSRNFFLYFIAIIFFTTSCGKSIKLDIVRQSSELNHCEIVFGTDLDKLTQENAILLQMGVIDTTDEHTLIPVAIVVINKKEIILNQKNHSDTENKTSKTYEGKVIN